MPFLSFPFFDGAIANCRLFLSSICAHLAKFGPPSVTRFVSVPSIVPLLNISFGAFLPGNAFWRPNGANGAGRKIPREKPKGGKAEKEAEAAKDKNEAIG
ncbi:hypothetical protein niasHT_009474 [Heterodera trifolii]|uniref:Uncharacterized protein n=1 Tax=Heterodera trifolii TaxID=157864 RepID=A0ABD2MEK5_9BILA